MKKVLWQHRTIVSAGYGGSFTPQIRREKLEIHAVFLRFRDKFVAQNSLPNLLAKLYGIAFFFLFFICILTFPAMADFQVDLVSAEATVQENGRAKVTETVQLTFEGTEDKVTIPLPEGSLSRISGETFRYRVDKTDEGVNVVFSSKNGFSGTQTFMVSYSVDAPEDLTGEEISFTLGVLSSRWAKDVGACHFQISLPAAYSPLPEDFQMAPTVLSGYYGDLSQEETGLSVSGTVISGDTEKRMAYDSLALQVDLPGGYFYVRRAAIPVVSVSFLAIGMLAVLALCVLYWRLKLRTPWQAVSPRLLTPGGLLPCQLPQALDGMTCDLAALMLEWANLGYLSIAKKGKDKVLLTRGIQMGSERSKAEQQLYQQIFAGKRRVTATPRRFSKAAARFRAISRRSLGKVCFDRTGGNVVLVQIPCRILLAVGTGYMSYMLMPEGGGFVILALLFGVAGFYYSIYFHSLIAQWKAIREFTRQTALVLVIAAGLLILALLNGALVEMGIGLAACGFSAIFTAAGPRRSQRGRDILAETRGCRMFYHQVTWQRLQVLTGRDSRFFQRQLPKAVALRADRALAKRCERLPVPQPEWLSGIKLKTFSAGELQKQLRPILKILREAFR